MGHDDHYVPAEADHHFGGDHITPDDNVAGYHDLDDDINFDNQPEYDDRALDDDLEQLTADIQRIVNHFYDCGPDDNDIVDRPDEPHTPGHPDE